MRTSDIIPVTANLHVTSVCNYRCVFCYAVFPGLRVARGPEEWIAVIRLLAEAPPLLGRYKIDKLTFAGGEPTLVPYLPELLRTTAWSSSPRCLAWELRTGGRKLAGQFMA